VWKIVSVWGEVMWPETVRKEDLRIDYYRGSGKGGQKRNKTSNACRITHKITGLSAQCEDGRSQTKNKETAFLRLADRLVPLMKIALEHPKEMERVTERIRTYHEPDQRVKDDRTGRVYQYTSVIYGNGFDRIVEDLVCLKE
jgi:protein subunit release factor A